MIRTSLWNMQVEPDLFKPQIYIVWCSSCYWRYVVSLCQDQKGSQWLSERRLWMPVNLQRDSKILSNCLKSTIWLHGNLSTSGIDFKWLIICPGLPSQFRPWGECLLLKEVSKNSHFFFCRIYIYLYASTLKKNLCRFNLPGRCARKKPLPAKEHMYINIYASQLAIVNKGQTFWNNVLWTNESKMCLATVIVDMLGFPHWGQHLRRTSRQLWSMVVKMLWFGIALLL